MHRFIVRKKFGGDSMCDKLYAVTTKDRKDTPEEEMSLEIISIFNEEGSSFQEILEDIIKITIN